MDGVGGRGKRWISMGSMKARMSKDYQEFYAYDLGDFRFQYRVNFDDMPDRTWCATFQDERGRRQAKKSCFLWHHKVKCDE